MPGKGSLSLLLYSLASLPIAVVGFAAACQQGEVATSVFAVLVGAYCLAIARDSFRRLVGLTCLAALMASTSPSVAAVRTTNFVVSSAPAYEQPLAQAAERFRKELAIDWIGEELPDWGTPCPIQADIANGLGNGGATSFTFVGGGVYDLKMHIQGDPARIVESVLKHEVLHAVFATHFRQPLPRWADEGACTTVESGRDRTDSQRMLVKHLQTGRGIPFSDLFHMREYPRDIMPLYAHGHSLVTFLLEHGGKRYFVDFLAAGLRDQDWSGAVSERYGYNSLGQLQEVWLDWVVNGSPLVPGQVRLRAPDT